MAEPDECPEEVRRLGQVVDVGDDLARVPVGQQDLDGHRAPAQRIAGPVIGAEPHEVLEQAPVVRVLESRAEGRAEEALGQCGAGVVGPLRAHVPGPAVREEADRPLEQRAAGRPAVGLDRRIGEGGELHRLGDAGPGVGRVEAGERHVRVVGRRPHHVHQLGRATRDEEGVLHQGAEVVVDEDHGRELVPTGQPDAEHDVVPVAEDVPQLDHGACRLRLIEVEQPARERVAAGGDLAADPVAEHVVAGQPGQRGQQRGRLRDLDGEEAVDELLAIGRCGLGRPRERGAGLEHREHRAGEPQEGSGMPAARAAATSSIRSGSRRPGVGPDRAGRRADRAGRCRWACARRAFSRRERFDMAVTLATDRCLAGVQPRCPAR
ncbi:hypothetical protein [Blastococcus sp. PRF04-17]|uniref:hypothetical protein n=1 Tax=Blastococcus sp. PRF04-17 TaxID=2933797 RepID=UPI001FF2941E|nr:hypothetical protein [Blastococcus sp. PRF04-17]UOY01865.1 hypothetical protein MVA48_00290 [Blastococcus sp. PRF04-17]